MLAGGLYERTSGAAGQPLAGYRRRELEHTVLHELVARYGQTMLAEVRAADPEGGGLPRHVERELTEYLRCGVLAHGFARVRCMTCHEEIVVAFSCKRRGLCPSCTARRMADTAAHLVDHVLPRAPYRQWVVTVPKALRLRLARDPGWTTWVGNLAVRAIGAWQRRIARQRGLRAPRTGAITFVQRFGGLVNLNCTSTSSCRTACSSMTTTGSLSRPIQCRPAPTCWRSSIASCAGSRVGSPTRHATIAHRRARTGPGRGGGDVALAPQRQPTVRGVERLRAWCEGFSLHAGVVIADHDREALERLCRYGTRPAFAHDRLAWTADRQIAYRLKRPWPDGRTELVLPPVTFLRRLCGIIPPPRRHLVRYAGVFGPASQRRAQLRALVPARDGESPPAAATPSGSTRAGRVPWAELLRRVFATDVLASPCGGRRSVIAVVVDSARARAVLTVLGLPCTPTTFAPARDPPQGELWFDDAS
jgi:hypothetical protein